MVATQLCCCIVKTAIDNMYMNEHGCVPIKLIYKNRQWAGFHLWAMVCQPMG